MRVKFTIDFAHKYKNDRTTGTATTTGYPNLKEQLDQLYRDINAGKFGSDATTNGLFHIKCQDCFS